MRLVWESVERWYDDNGKLKSLRLTRKYSISDSQEVKIQVFTSYSASLGSWSEPTVSTEPPNLRYENFLKLCELVGRCVGDVKKLVHS